MTPGSRDLADWQARQTTRSHPRVYVDTALSGAVAQAGRVLLVQAAEVTGLTGRCGSS